MGLQRKRQRGLYDAWRESRSSALRGRPRPCSLESLNPRLGGTSPRALVLVLEARMVPWLVLVISFGHGTHGCFREYQYRIGRENSTLCLTCGLAEAEHTLSVCLSWFKEQAELVASIESHLFVRAKLGSEEVGSPLSAKMSQKEAVKGVGRGGSMSVNT